MNMFYVYSVQNKINNKIYIGKTGNLEERWADHRKIDGGCPVLHKAFKKYGLENFEFNVIQTIETEDEANKLEIKYIAEYKSNIKRYGKKFGYNLTDGGDGISGFYHTKETKQKISNKNKGNTYCVGREMSDETRTKISNSLKGKNTGEKHPFYGKKRPEIGEKISKSKKGKYLGENNFNAKLTNQVADQIRQLYSTNEYTYKDLALLFDFSKTTIARVIKNKDYFAGNKK